MAFSDEIKEGCFKLHYFHHWSYRKISRFFEGNPGRKSVRKFCKQIESRLLRTMTHDEILSMQFFPRILINSH